MLWCFWSALALIAYTYVGFPLLVLLRALLFPRACRGAPIEPRVTLIVVAHNEAAAIETKLKNILALNYPRNLLQIIVASDGSSDATNSLVGSYAPRGVELLALPRRGKIAALNDAVVAANGEVLVFSDANSMYHPNAICELVWCLADPQVGGVAGDQQYSRGTSTADVGERSYWSFDRLMKRAQSRAGSATSATGAIYAVRRSLVHETPDGVTDDFFVSTGVIAQGYRLVFAPRAIAYEPAASRGAIEFGRKVRVATRGFRAVAVRRRLLNPFRHGFYSVQLASHKVLRRLMFGPLALLFVSSALVWRLGSLYQAAFAAQVLLYGCALLGGIFAGKRWANVRLLSLPFYFALVNVACAAAAWNVARGHRIDRWDPQRDVPMPLAVAQAAAGGKGS